jgi:hypothetical protein
MSQITRGYEYVQQQDHPFATNRGYVLKHRLIMEKHIGRYLQPDEVVHHKNNNRLDNGIENLELENSKSSHRKLHISKTTYYLDNFEDYIIKRYGEGIGAHLIAKEVKSHKSCILKWLKKQGIQRREPKKKVECKEGYKWCNVCKKELGISAFYISKNTYDGFRNRCIECTKNEAKKYYKEAQFVSNNNRNG